MVGLRSQEDNGLSISIEPIKLGSPLSQHIESADLAVGRSCDQGCVRVIVCSGNFCSPVKKKTNKVM